MRTKSENYLKGDEICLESKLKNIPENKSLSTFPMIMLKCSLSYWMMTNLKRSITIEHLKLPNNTWLPPLCSHLLASPCQSGSQPQPKEMSSRIDKEPRTRISKYLFFVTCQSTFMIGTLKSEAILMSPLPLVGFNSQYFVFMINL